MSELDDSAAASEYARHGRFVRRLALRLASDEAAAEDLAQDTWLAALQARSASSRHVRSWFAQVVRNKFVQRVRSESRRRAREVGREPAEAVADTADVVERIELHRHVVEAVLDLPEPYRSVLVRRFSEEEDVATIAERLELSESTVRTRLRRGLEKLRERLRGELGGTPAVFLAALQRLQTPPGPGSVPVAPPAPTPPVTPFVPIVMKQALLTVAALTVVALVWFAIESPTSAPLAMEPADRGSETAVAVEPIDAPRAEPAALVAAAASERTELEAEPATPAADVVAAIDPSPSVEEPIGTLTLRIEDVHGRPIPRARLTATQWRSVEDPGAAYWWGDEDERAMGESDLEGIVHLRYQKQHALGEGGTVTLGAVGFEVSHPEYVTHTEYGLDVQAGDTVIVLERGSFLVVSGWIGSSSTIVTDVRAHLTDDVDVGRDDWIPIGDGRPSCSRIPPGVHGIYLSHTDGDGARWFSDVVTFELGEEEHRELSLELHPGARMVGTLDERVPRPVHDGEVELNLYVDDGIGAKMLRTYRETIAEDGSFRFTNLPPGKGEIVGLCDGWASARTESGDAEESARWTRRQPLQQLDPAAHQTEPFVLVMEPTATARITVEGPDGQPVEGARVSAWPNVIWGIGYASILLDRTWQATTDAEGVAVLRNLPVDDPTVTFGVHTAEGYRMPLESPDGGGRGAEIELASGATAETTIRLDPPE